MNFSLVFYIIGWVLTLEAAFMTVPCITALCYGEAEISAFLITMGICLVIGLPLILRKPRKKLFYIREGYITVAVSWLVLSIMGALPFCISGSIPNVVDALFETVSGFTTTGASILPEVESLPKCILMWRSFTHWIGGMGVLVFLLTLLPAVAGGSVMNLMRAESPGPSVTRLVPKVRKTAIILYGIYLVMTVVETVLLLLGGMDLFQALCTAFGTAGTGGFGFLNDSMASFSPYLQMVITVFMILFGVNFSVFYLILAGKLRQALKNEELRWYLVIIGVSILVIAWNILPLCEGLWDSLRLSSFQVASIITTTGYSTADFDLWPTLSKTILVVLMMIGACAGSTGGGMKVSRLLLILRSVRKELYQMLHPTVVRKVKMDGRTVEHEVIRSTNAYISAYVAIFAASVLLVSLENFDLTTTFTAVAATFNNIGPGLQMVGPTAHFGIFTPFTKLVLTLDMLAGRLELFPLLLLASPATWKTRE